MKAEDILDTNFLKDGGWIPEIHWADRKKIINSMKEFAEFHVKEALKAAAEHATTITKENNRLIFGNSQHFEWEEVDKESIINAPMIEIK